MMTFIRPKSTFVVLLLNIVVVIIAVVNSAPSSPYASFLKLNANPSGLPLSYYVPSTYFPSIPESERPHDHTKPEIVASCNYELVPPANLDAYEFQTEQFLSTLGLNLYDGACWSIAQSILGNTGVVQQYMQNTLLEHKTLQFGDIKADRPCQGQLEPYGNCTDPAQNGNCGFCYGSNLVSLPTSQAYFFRMISDYWCLLGTVDARCPQLDHLWCWNDYSPITGENSWANLIGTIQTEYITAGGNVNNIPDSSPAMQLATSFLSAIAVMTLPNGAVYYAPYNTYSENTPDVGATVSVENNVSLLAGLKMLYAVISQKQSSSFKSLLPQIQASINGITNFLRTSYEPELGFFRQGGRYNRTNGAWTWTNFPFAADCQTWALAVLGPSVVDGWFGAGTSLNIWNVTKAISGYNYNRATGWVDGVGFSDNVKDQVFSGEWTLGAVNMLRVIAEASNSSVASSLQAEANHMRQAVSTQLTSTFTYPTGESATAILYANKRYYIPFGWWANPLPSMASSGWAVMTDNNFNPFYLGGAYKS